MTLSQQRREVCVEDYPRLPAGPSARSRPEPTAYDSKPAVGAYRTILITSIGIRRGDTYASANLSSTSDCVFFACPSTEKTSD